MIIQDLFEEQQSCPHCGGPMFSEMLMMEKKDACYYKVKASAKVWPSAYASGRLVQCRKKGADSYGNKSESMLEGSEESYIIVRTDSEGKQDVFAGNFDTYERAQKELDACLAHPLHTKYKQKFEIKRKGQQGQKGVAEEYELAGVGVAYELGRRAYKERKTARDNPYSATREARKNDEWAKGLERGKHDANDARHFRGSVREQGMAEAGDSNFVGFMNKTLADKVDSPKADPMSGAPDFYRNAAVSTLDARRGFKNALKFGLKALSRLDPETRQQLATGSEQAVANYLTDVAERSGQMGDNTFVEEDITEVQDYLGDVFHDPSINSWKDVLQQSQGMSDGQLDEKSVSQAQFRTMAAAAHNPKFAKKVGIKQSVAKEFNQADKGSNYKKLPDRTTEGSDDNFGTKAALLSPSPQAAAQAKAIVQQQADRNAISQAKILGYVPVAAEEDVEEAQYDRGDYYNARMGGEYGKGMSASFDGGGGDGTGRGDIHKGQTKHLSADPFGRSGSSVPQSGTGKIYTKALPDEMDEGEQQKGADYRDPPEADYGDDYQDMVARVKKLAGLGPLKTVYDPNKRVYRNMPTAVQPKK